MFDPRSSKDRINYGDALIPPAGYYLERAIGTTYSLDLETLTAISLSLGLSEDTDSELINNPIGLLNALQKVSEKVTVFCEAGQIKLPHKHSELFLLLEKMIVPVKLPHDESIGRYSAFHPKMWILEYANPDGEKKYRFVVMSRNMTFDHSWDIACSLEGNRTRTINESSEPLLHFLRFLKQQLDSELADYGRQNEELSYFISNITRINFVPDERFTSFEICPLGIGKEAYSIASDALFNENFHELVIMSPFVTGSVISDFNEDWKTLTNTQRTLITRKSELSKIMDGRASNFNVYVMKDIIVEGETVLSEGEKQAEEAFPSQDIHAKLFIRRKHSTVDLYLGSMNATYAAINSNVEMMIHLQTKQSVLSGEKFICELMGDNRDNNTNPFELVDLSETSEEPEQSTQDIVERIIKSICRLTMHAVVVPSADNKYIVKLNAEYDDLFDCEVQIRPLRVENAYNLLKREMEFTNLERLDLSEFYVLKVSKDGYPLERVIMIPTEGIPEERDAEIIKSVIKNKRAFIEYVAFVLGDDYIQTLLENKKAAEKYGEWKDREIVPAVYEKMLKASVSHPERIQEIQHITSVIEDDIIIPKEFTDMYKVFCDTLGIE